MPKPSGPERVQQALERLQLDCRVETLPASTRTAEEAAAAVGCAVAEIAKSLVFRGTDSDSAILAVMSGVNRVDTAKLAAVAGEPVGRPDADFVRARTGFAIGGVPPIGHAPGIVTFIDRDLLALPWAWAAAGSPFSVFRVETAALLAASEGRAADLKQ